ncbi:MAG: MmcQ/YjbR family DNA-binding protein [Dehalococcoidia bacterium]
MDPIERVREICLALPEATEKEAWGEATFRVRGKMFAMADVNHHDSGHVAIWCKAPEGAQDILAEADPGRFFVPPYVGKSGWIGIRLDGDGVDWDEVADLLSESYRMTAPKRLLERFEV